MGKKITRRQREVLDAMLAGAVVWIPRPPSGPWGYMVHDQQTVRLMRCTVEALLDAGFIRVDPHMDWTFRPVYQKEDNEQAG